MRGVDGAPFTSDLLHSAYANLHAALLFWVFFLSVLVLEFCTGPSLHAWLLM